MSSRIVAAPALALLIVAGCGGAVDPGDVIARLRNSPPVACTAAQQAACPAVRVTSCPAGQEPVIDYSSDCCQHFTCQPICSAAARSCPMTPAPTCPPRTQLWIGTAIEDCCPAYRCQPDGSTCDPTREMCGCDATNARCTLSLPYCGDGVRAIVVGNTADCCPIYQCPCDTAVDANGTVPPEAIAKCGCTFPNCQAGEQIHCAGLDHCMGPCECRPARGICKDDSTCGPGEKCDLSSCRLPPDQPATTTMVAECDPARCGPRPGAPVGMCPDGSGISGPTGRCLLNADGACAWEIRECPAPGCYGICVPNVPQTGCQADGDCPMGQKCDVQCREWGCTPGSMGTGTPTTTTTDPATGMTVPPLPPGMCACDLNDTSCTCDPATDTCKGRTCVGQCVPPTPTCDPMRPVACPAIAQVCPNGQMPVATGVDPNTCCPTYTCPVCSRSTMMSDAPTACPAIECRCAKQTGTDVNSCCPKYECTMPLADGSCPR
jgi:hypothetical protein